MRDTEKTIIEYDFSRDESYRERVVSIASCPGKDPPLIGPEKWRHERIACDSGAGTEVDVRVLCTCGWAGPAHKTESEAIEAFNASRGARTIPVTGWIVHERINGAPEGDLPF